MNHEKKIVLTKDGSYTLRIDALKESYHSLHGALTESEFIYLNHGLHFWQENNQGKRCRILEIGYGTGLISYLSYLAAQKSQTGMDYTAIEPYPLTSEESELLIYDNLFEISKNQLSHKDFSKLLWEKSLAILPEFNLLKKKILFEHFKSTISFDLIFFDAFGAHVQPDLWGTEWMRKSYNLLRSGGVWVSFCAKGSVRRSLQEVGFEVERLEGPPGKREMLRAIKP